MVASKAKHKYSKTVEVTVSLGVRPIINGQVSLCFVYFLSIVMYGSQLRGKTRVLNVPACVDWTLNPAYSLIQCYEIILFGAGRTCLVDACLWHTRTCPLAGNPSS